MQQPSAQGIASLYRGNPEPLQQSIQKEQQAKPGLPPDLQKMLALQIVTNEKDSATAQKAMQQLQQMGGQSGTPPTVMQSLQDQAAQKLQAQAVQAQQKQQGIQALMQQAPASGVPEGTPQPEAQPEAPGIDQLPVDFQMAEGGVVAFDSGGEVDAAKEEAKAALAQLQSYGLAQRKNDPDGFQAAQARAAAAAQKLQATRSAYAQEMSAQGMDRPVQATGMPKVRPQQAAPQLPASDGINQSIAETARLQRQTSLPQAPAAVSSRGIKALVEKRVAAPAQAAPAAPTAVPAGSAQAAYDNYLQKSLTTDRDTERTAEEARFAAAGKQDTSQYDRMLAELDKRKQELAPKQGYEGLMEYLSQIGANSQPGQGSFASGAAGARAVGALNKERQTQQFELTKQGVEIAQKKLDADRAFSLDKYKAGQEGAKRIDDVAKDAAKEFGLDARNEKTLANQIKVQLLQNQGSLASANVRTAGSENKEIAAAEAAIARDPRAKAHMETIKAYAMQPKNPNAVAAMDSLNQLREATYKQFGITLAGAPGAASPGGTTRMRFDAQGNPIK